MEAALEPTSGSDASGAPSPAGRAPSPENNANTARSAARQKRRDDARNWVPRGSVAFKNMDLKLHSEQAQRVFHLAFVHAQMSLHQFFESLAATDEAMRAGEKVIMERFEKIESQFKEVLEQLKATAAAVVADPMDGYTNPVTLQVRMYTPEAARFASLLLMFDEIERWVEVCLFAGRMSRPHHHNVRESTRNALIRFSRQIHLKFLEARRAKFDLQKQRDRDRQQKHAKQAQAAKLEAKEIAAARQAAGTKPTSQAPSPHVDTPASAAKPAKRARKTNGAAEPTPAIA